MIILPLNINNVFAGERSIVQIDPCDCDSITQSYNDCVDKFNYCRDLAHRQNEALKDTQKLLDESGKIIKKQQRNSKLILGLGIAGGFVVGIGIGGIIGWVVTK